MPTFDYDFRFLQAGIELLEKYLLAVDVFWPIGIGAARGEAPYPQLTLGALLLARQRAQATARTPTQQAELERLSIEMEALRSRWRVAWGKKAAAEFRARLNLWRDFLEEYRKEPEANYDRYAYEVGRRVLLQMLEAEAIDLPAAQLELLRGLDALLKAVFVEAEFAWETVLAVSFPRQEYWYLYGKVSRTIVGVKQGNGMPQVL